MNIYKIRGYCFFISIEFLVCGFFDVWFNGVYFVVFDGYIVFDGVFVGIVVNFVIMDNEIKVRYLGFFLLIDLKLEQQKDGVFDNDFGCERMKVEFLSQIYLFEILSIWLVKNLVLLFIRKCMSVVIFFCLLRWLIGILFSICGFFIGLFISVLGQ